MNKVLAKAAILASELTTEHKRFVCGIIDQIEDARSTPAYAFAAIDMTIEQHLEANSVLLAALPPSVRAL